MKYQDNIHISNLRIDFDDKLIAILLATIAILSSSPVILFGHNNALIALTCSLFILFIIKQLFLKKHTLVYSNHLTFFIAFLLMLYISIPFREHDRFSFSIIWCFIFIATLFVKKQTLQLSFRYLSNYIYIICIASLFILTLNALGISLPNHRIDREFGGYFTSYFISAKLSGQDYTILGINLYRLNGIFSEPGHFGILLCMVLYCNEEISRRPIGKVVILTSILTLSFATYILLFGLFVKKIFINKKIKTLIIFIISLVLIFAFTPHEILERFFFDKIDGSLEDRTSDYFIDKFDAFISSNNILLGYGRDVLEFFNIRNSDYRGYLIRYGYFGAILNCLLFTSIYRKQSFRVFFLGAYFFLIIFAHRSWLIDHYSFLYFIYIFPIIYKDHSISRSRSNKSIY